MGDLAVSYVQQFQEKKDFLRHLMKDVKALDLMIKSNLFENNIQRIGAEQELSLVSEDSMPACIGPELLPLVNDEHLTTEIGLYNLEVNLDPFNINASCLSEMENQLSYYLDTIAKAAAQYNSKICLCGILPSINRHHLTFDHITPLERYIALSKRLHEMRGNDFEIHIQGTDELLAKLDSVLFEACNTSFQLHLQVSNDDFVDQYNWAQWIAGPMLAISANSPILLGRELWMESRIALFQQSIDTRTPYNTLRYRQPRVSFGNRWIENSAVEIFRDQIAKFPILITKEIKEDALEKLEKGGTPKLKALRTHNGTVYSWNRACYGISDNGQAHLRIENRYLPSGPSAIDEMANFALWLGLQKAGDLHYRGINKQIPFKLAKENFLRAAKEGIHTVLHWEGESMNACRLTLEKLLPLAEEGLNSFGIDSNDINRYLNIIERRVSKCVNGASWQVSNYRKLLDRWTAPIASQELTKAMVDRQVDNLPIHEWDEIKCAPVISLAHKLDKVSHWMTTDLYVVYEGDSLDLVKNIMEWNNIRHLPVENDKGHLVGLLTKSMFENLESEYESFCEVEVKDVMITDITLGNEQMTLTEAKAIMTKKGIGCLPVVDAGSLIGILTDTDLKRLDY
ncbi:MAG: CBS domain-containing protein [Bacteroidota bacterium]